MPTMRTTAVLALVGATLLGSGCGASAPTTGPAPAATTRTVTITVTGSRVDPPPGVVEVGPDQTLRLVVTSDHDDSLHAHGFEVEKDLRAGVPLTVDLRGAAPGRYEVETHRPALQLLVVQVR